MVDNIIYHDNNVLNNNVYLSIIIPAYRQGQSIRTDITNVANAVKQITHDYELIVVVDGCPDDTLEHALKCEGEETVSSATTLTGARATRCALDFSRHLAR